MQKLIIGGFLTVALLSPVLANAQVVTTTATNVDIQSLRDELTVLITQLIAQLQAQINQIIATQATSTQTIMTDNNIPLGSVTPSSFGLTLGEANFPAESKVATLPVTIGGSYDHGVLHIRGSHTEGGSYADYGITVSGGSATIENLVPDTYDWDLTLSGPADPVTKIAPIIHRETGTFTIAPPNQASQ